MLLKPNTAWITDSAQPLPAVDADVRINGNFLEISFDVKEPPECFRAEMCEDGGRSWEDSCVEAFVLAADGSGDYFNFECNSRGFLLAARGKDRNGRKAFSKEEYAEIKRKVCPPQLCGNILEWGVVLRIPAKLLGCAGNIEKTELRGNLYKCADKAKAPHYLSAFPIDAPRPDFHRPEFFQNLGEE